MVPLLVLKKARSWTISLLQRSSGHVILGMQLGFRGPGMNSLACRLADLLVFCRSSDYVCISIIMHIWPVFCTLLMFIFLDSMDWGGTCTLQPQSHRCRKWSLFHTKVGKLKIKPAIYLLVSLLLAVPGVFLTVEGLVTRSGLKPLQSLATSWIIELWHIGCICQGCSFDAWNLKGKPWMKNHMSMCRLQDGLHYLREIAPGHLCLCRRVWWSCKQCDALGRLANDQDQVVSWVCVSWAYCHYM